MNPVRRTSHSIGRLALVSALVVRLQGPLAASAFAQEAVAPARGVATGGDLVGYNSIHHPAIGRDGMVSGINIEATVKLAQSLTIPVIASGGLSGMNDIEQLCAVEKDGVEGVICGRAIYSGDLDFAAAQERADQLKA